MNNFNLLKSFAFICISFLFISCATKITVTALRPSIVYDKDIKQVSILKFKNDNISLSSYIEAKMGKILFDDKKYFKIINREDIDTILEEQKLQDSGLVNDIDENLFGLSTVKSLITGKVNSTTKSTKYFYETRTNYDRCLKYKVKNGKKRYCERYAKYKVRCTKYSFNVNATISISKVSNANMIYNETFSEKYTTTSCSDSHEIVANEKVIYEELSHKIASDFVSKISPSYYDTKVILIEDEDISYTNTEEKLFSNGLKLIELDRINKAKIIFERLVLSTTSKSSTALYGLALCEELLGNLDTAYALYIKAEDITLLNDLNEDISNAVKRVRKALISKQRATKQINN